MKNNGQKNGKLTEIYRVVPGLDMWVMINLLLAHKNHVGVKFRFASNKGIDAAYEKGKNEAITYAELTGAEEDIRKYVNAISVNEAGKPIDVLEKYI